MKDYRVRIGLRDPNSDKYVGNSENGIEQRLHAETQLPHWALILKRRKEKSYFMALKIDFVVKDVLGREWQLGTVQVDYNLPERFKLAYTGSDGEKHQPVMIHRAPFGSWKGFAEFLLSTLMECFQLGFHLHTHSNNF